MLTEILFVFFLTLILVSLLVPVGRYRVLRTRVRGRKVAIREGGEPGESGVVRTMLFFFLLLFSLTLAGSYWVTPYGPTYLNISWVPIVIIGLVLTLLIAAISPLRPAAISREETEAEDPVEARGSVSFSLTYFLLLIIAFSLIIAAFF